MESNRLNRRQFNKLSLAALGGAVTGAFLGGCESQQNGDGGGGGGADVSLLLQEPHVCKGLNTCKGKGASKENACAGQGACATAAHHACRGQNECKGQGGCGEAPGTNACKGMGGCSVPLSKDAWAKARKSFETAMANAGKKVGPAPQ